MMIHLNKYYLFILATIILVILNPFVYQNKYAGDAVIHLIYAENAATGNFFEFNPGEKSSGVTSPGYMLLLALLFKIFPATFIPIVVKIINILFWYGLLLLIFLIIKKIFPNSFLNWLTLLIAGTLPGSTYNATIGMENGIFAFIIFLWFYLALKWKWFDPYQKLLLKEEFILGLIMGIAFWIRPEGLIVFIIIILQRYFFQNRKIEKSLYPLLPFGILSSILIYFLFSQTGRILPSSGISRTILSWQNSFMIGLFPINLKPIIRLTYYFPLTLFWIIGIFSILKKKGNKEIKNFLMLLISLSGIFLILFSSLLSSLHLSRYLIFIMPMMILVATIGIKELWEKKNSSQIVNIVTKMVISFLLITLSLIFIKESTLRINSNSYYKLAKQGPLIRKTYSNSLLSNLKNKFPTPISLAYQEVQIRYALDKRFIVRSLDGRTDRFLLKYIKNGKFDHIGYIKERKINYIMETPCYDRDKKTYSLSILKDLKKDIIKNGVKFTRLPNNRYFRVEF